MSFQTALNATDRRVAYSKRPQAACPLVAPETGAWRGSASTTNAAPIAATLYTPTKSQAVVVKLRAVALKSDGTMAAVWEITAGFRCDATGALAPVGSATAVATGADASFAPTAALGASGASIVATLTGVAATNIRWTFEAEIV